MNGKTIVFSCFVFVMLAAANASALVGSPSIDIVLTNQTPYPAEPGDVVTLGVEVQNNGYGAAENLVVEINVTDPFMLLPGEEQTKTFVKIGASKSVKTSYKLHVDSHAVSDNYKIKFFSYQSGDTSIKRMNEISLNVQGNPNLIIEDVTTNPGRLNPGDVVQLKFRIKNVGTGSAKDIEIQFPNTTYLKPVLSTGEVYIEELGPGETRDVEMDISIDSSAEQETYTPELTISYRDEGNALATDTKIIGLSVSGSINLEIIKIEPLYERNILRIEVANKGTTEAKSLEAKLIIGNKTIDIDYVSQLKENRKTTFDFPLVLKGTGNLVMDYIGPGIEKNQVSKEIVLNYEIPSSGNGTLTGAAVIVVLVILYIFWRKFRKKK